MTNDICIFQLAGYPASKIQYPAGYRIQRKGSRNVLCIPKKYIKFIKHANTVVSYLIRKTSECKTETRLPIEVNFYGTYSTLAEENYSPVNDSTLLTFKNIAGPCILSCKIKSIEKNSGNACNLMPELK
jgi:hypothetical protein